MRLQRLALYIAQCCTLLSLIEQDINVSLSDLWRSEFATRHEAGSLWVYNGGGDDYVGDDDDAGC